MTEDRKVMTIKIGYTDEEFDNFLNEIVAEFVVNIAMKGISDFQIDTGDSNE